MTHHNERITKAGRKDLRYAMVTIANNCVDYHPYWKAAFEKLVPRIGCSKTIVATARSELVAVCHV